MATASRCRTHKAEAGWRCNGCGEVLCPDCAGLQRIGPVQMPACTLCGEGLEPLTRHRLEGGTLLERLPRAFLFPFNGEGFLALAALALLNTLLGYGGACGALIGAGLTMGSLFAVVRATARGAQHLELADFGDLMSDVIMPLVRFVVATLPLWAGVILAVMKGTPLLWAVVIALAVFWVPMALLAAATSSPLTSLLNPALMVGLAVKLGRDYLVYLGGLLACGVVLVLVGGVGFVVARLPLWVVGSFIGWVLQLIPLMLMAHVGGLVLYVRGDTLGYGVPQDYLEPVLGQVEPRGVVRERETQAARGGSRAPIELAPEAGFAPESSDLDAVFGERPSFSASPAAPAEARRPARTELDPSALPARVVQEEVSEAGRAIRAAMTRGDGAEALRQWEEAGRLVPELTVAELSWLGRSAAASRQDATALAAFEAASWAGGGADVAAARVMLARLLVERLGRAGEGKKWMQRVADESPDTEAGRFAKGWLAKQS